MILVSSFYKNSVSFFKQDVLPVLYDSQKKIGVIALAIFSCFIACYAIYHLKKRKFEKKKVEFSDIPNEILILIFRQLKGKGWNSLSQVNKNFSTLSKQPEVIASLFEKDIYIPFEQKIELAKHAGGFLTKLDLNRSPITDPQLEEILIACPNIKNLNLSECKKLSNACIVKLPQNLQILDLHGFANLNEENIGQLPRSLYSLDLSNQQSLNEASIANLPQGLRFLELNWLWSLNSKRISKLPRGLQSLSLSHCSTFQGDLTNLPNGIHTLNLSGCNWVTDDIIATIPQSVYSLRISLCKKITDEGIKRLPENLQELDMWACDQFSESIIPKLPKGLKRLNLRGCNPELIHFAKRKLPGLLIFS